MKIKNFDNCAHLTWFQEDWYGGKECTKGHEFPIENCEDWECEEEYNREFDKWIEKEAKREGW